MRNTDIAIDKKYSETVILLLLFVVCLLVFYSSFKYGFVSDDYNRITIHSVKQLVESWKVVNLSRPLDELFYFTFNNLFRYKPLPYRVFLLFIYFLNSFLVYRLIRALTKSQMVGFLIAILFAANTVQFRNIYWISCNLLLFATTFNLLAALFFWNYLENRKKGILVISFALVFGGLLLTKEDLAAFPVTALVLSGYLTLNRKGTIGKDNVAAILRPTLIFWSIPVIFVLYRTVLSWVIGGIDKCPYNLLDCLNPQADSPHHVGLLGPHIIANLGLQWFWNMGSLGFYWVIRPFSKYAGVFEWESIGLVEAIVIFSSLGGFFLLYWSVRKSTSWWHLILGVVWFVGALLPTIFLPDYIQNYFSAFAAIGLFLAVIIPLQSLLVPYYIKVIRVVGAALVFLYLINSVYWIHWNENVNVITKSSTILQRMESDLKSKYAIFPSHTNLVFVNLGYWWLGYGTAPKVMYNDFTMDVFSVEDFIQKGDKIYSKKSKELDISNTHVFLNTREGFREVTPGFFKRYNGVIQ